jgi:hypothetical protein
LADIEVIDGVEFVVAWSWNWDSVPSNQGALRDSAVLNMRLDDLDGVVFEVEVNFAFSDSVLLFSFFVHGFLKVSVETEDLPVKSYPSWGTRTFAFWKDTVIGFLALAGHQFSADTWFGSADEHSNVIGVVEMVAFMEFIFARVLAETVAREEWKLWHFLIVLRFVFIVYF